MEDRFFVLSRECYEAYSDEDWPSDCRLLLSRFNTPHMSSFEIDLLGHNLYISQDPNSKHLGTTVWDSSLVFAKFIERNSRKGEFSRSKISGKRVIELGAGCGLAGLGMALLGCNVVVTDQMAVLPLLLRNMERNLARAKYAASDHSYLGSIGNVKVAELDWGNEAHIAAVEPPFDYIIGTDVVYVEHLLEPLITTILSLAGPKSTVLLGYEFRASGVREQLHELCKKHFHVKKVLHAKMDATYQHPNIDLFILRRIASSTSNISITERGVSTSATPHESDAVKTLHADQHSREQITENADLSCREEGDDVHSLSCQAQEDGDVLAGIKDKELSSDEELCETKRPMMEENGLKPLTVSSKAGLSHLDSRGQPSEWELRRLGSSAARLLSEISLPSN